MIYMQTCIYALVQLDPLNIIRKKNKNNCIITRIEPPLHPDGPEKILMDFGVEPEEFKEDDLLEWFGLNHVQLQHN